ncbi:MAG: gliding motility-associated C-terminal domain-containing protein [Bacteroidales bacterium]|nr:gliding motility-associated C-terminal domain-containing protein [Bacteroidales bacterium]
MPTITTTATPNEICLGESTELTASSDITGTIFNWSDGLASNSTETVSPTTSTTYSVTGTTAEGCTGTAEVTIAVLPVPIIKYIVNPAHCGKSDASITLNVTGATPPYTYIWSNGSVDAMLNNISAGNYFVTVTDANGCSSFEIINVNDLPGPTANFAYKPHITTIENPIIYFENYSFGATSYYWDFGDGTSSEEVEPIHKYLEPRSYHVVLYAKDEYNCIDTIGADIIIKDISTFYLPNAFTPNNDDLNEVFNFVGAEINPINFEMRIFDRYGKQLFYTTDINQGWDGTYKGETVPEGVYTIAINFVSSITGEKHFIIDNLIIIK